ncbi:MAG: YdaU family protein [Polynucleobacter sp.]
MHYYKRNLGDYAKKAGRLTMLQHGAYTLLIDSCYDREVFPTLEQALEWTWASTEAEVEAVKFVLSRFFTLDKDGQYVQERILEELLHYHKNADTNKRIAEEREAKRKEKRTNREQVVNEAPPNHKPITTNQEPETKNQKPSQPYQALFDVFWGKYPKKVGKDAALKAFQKRKPDQHLLVQMLNALGEQSRSEAWVKDGGQFIPNPATWLNQGRWQDEVNAAMPMRTLNKQEALEASNRAVVDRLLMKEGLL